MRLEMHVVKSWEGSSKSGQSLLGLIESARKGDNLTRCIIRASSSASRLACLTYQLSTYRYHPNVGALVVWIVPLYVRCRAERTTPPPYPTRLPHIIRSSKLHNGSISITILFHPFKLFKLSSLDNVCSSMLIPARGIPQLTPPAV